MKDLNRRICGLLLTLAMVLSLCCPVLAAESVFPDTKGHWAEEIIQALAEDGIINGYGDGRCHPDASITRGQFATLVARALKLTPKVEGAQLYTDVAGHWASDYITALSETEIILPTDYGTAYEPDKEITRMEMVVMMVRAIGKESETPQSQGQTKFTDDGEITAADSGYVNVAAEYEIIVGYPDGRVCPYQGASRAEGFCITLNPDGWERHSYVACCGTSSIPVLNMLDRLPQLRQVFLCLDNDGAGHSASQRMAELITDRRLNAERLVPENKDWNEDLVSEYEQEEVQMHCQMSGF